MNVFSGWMYGERADRGEHDRQPDVHHPPPAVRAGRRHRLEQCRGHADRSEQDRTAPTRSCSRTGRRRRAKSTHSDPVTSRTHHSGSPPSSTVLVACRRRAAPACRPLFLVERDLLRALELVVADRARVVQLLQPRQLRRAVAGGRRGRRSCRPSRALRRELLQRLPPQRDDAERDQAAEEQDAPPVAQRVRPAPQDERAGRRSRRLPRRFPGARSAWGRASGAARPRAP